jgi:hypothetical protein
LTTPNWSTITQSQVREANSRQPRARSARKVDDSMWRLEGSRMAAVSAAASRNVAASTASPVAGLVA